MKIGTIGTKVKHTKYGWEGVIIDWVHKHPSYRSQPVVRWTTGMQSKHSPTECKKHRLEVMG